MIVITVAAGLTYGLMTAASIRAYAQDEALESAETLGITLADAILLENQGALRARGEAAAATMAALRVAVPEVSANEASARRQASRFLEAQRIGEAGYFFVVDSLGDVVYHPFASVAEQDQSGTPIVRRIVEQRRGFVRYYWQNPDEPTPREKHGYIAYFAPWDWYIVATDYATGFLERLPSTTLQSLLNGYQQASIHAAFVVQSDRTILGSSTGWDDVADVAREYLPKGRRLPLEARVSELPGGELIAFAPLQGFDAEVGVVFRMERLDKLFSRYVYIVVFSLVLAVLVIWVSSRIVGQYIAKPIRSLSQRLTRRLGHEHSDAQSGQADDLRELILQQLRALVRLDYETKGRHAAKREAIVAESVFRHTTEGIIVTNAEGVIIRVNPALETITGYQASELVGRNPRVLKSTRHRPDFYEVMWSTLETSGVWVGEIWNRRKGGEEYPQLLSIRAVRSEDGGEVDSYVAVCHDISERKETEERLHHLATHDSLTGLPNRTYLNSVLQQTLSHARRRESVTAVLFLDIDDFKDVNDSYGHEAGDQLLKWIARRLEFQLRSEDIVVRFGGDEFVIVLPQIEDAEYASVVARRVLAAAREPYLIEHQKIRPSVSIGIAIYPEAGRDAADLLRDADAAMYTAKRQGRNTYRFHNPGMNENAHRRLAMQGSIASAIDNGELSVVYQPILALGDNRIAGVEALVRWTRDGRLINPGEFLPFLENSSMLTRLDLWVLDQVCLEINSLETEEYGAFFVSVNAGAYNLIQDDFVHRVTETVARNGVNPARIAIEVTESAAIRNFDRARATLRDLQAAGFRLYLDDFGEGHSSIRYLREFGVDSVKLDRAYLQNVARSESARSLVSGFTQLAHGMRLEAVIEGVETPGQLEFIRRAGCDYAQGFLVGRPSGLVEALGVDVGALTSVRPE